MRQGQEGEAPARVTPRRQAAYDATFKVVREWPATANANARVWRAVEAALDAYEEAAA